MLTAALLAATEGGEATEAVVNPILPTTPELFWGAVSFFALWIIMRFVLLPPVLRVMEEREQRIQSAKSEADSATGGADEARAAYAARIEQARGEAAAIIAAAREEADRHRASELAAANAEIAAMRESATAEVAAAKAAALAQLRTQIAGVAVNAASRVIQKDLDLDRQVQVIEDYVNRSGRGPAA